MQKRRFLALTTAFVAILAMSGVAIAAHGFNDVPDNHTFHEDIQWMKENGITAGCNPPANTSYCPEDNVTRGQMAAFMHRFAEHLEGLADGPQGPPGPEGPRGPEGPQGEPGEPGADGADGIDGEDGQDGADGQDGEDGYIGNVLHNSFSTDAAPGHFMVAATCAGTDDMVIGEFDGPIGNAIPSYPIGGDAPNGPAEDYVAISGGYSVGSGSGSTDDVNISMSRTELTGTPGRAWLIAGHNNTGDSVNVRAWVSCVYAPDDNLLD